MKNKKVHRTSKQKGSKYYGLLGNRESNQIKLLTFLSKYLTIKEIAKITNKSLRQVYKSFKIYQKNGWINADRSLTKEGSQKVQLAYRCIAKGSLKPNTIRLHDLRFKVKVYNKMWAVKKEKLLEFKNIEYKPINMGFWKSDQITIDNFIIHLNPKNIIFIMPDYYGETQLEAFSKALEDLKLITAKLQHKLGIRLFNTRYLDFEISRNHYALIKNEIAEDYNKKNKRLFVYDDLGILRLVTDASLNMDELEAVSKDYAMSDSEKVKRLMIDVIDKDIVISTLDNNIKDTKRNLTKISEELVNSSLVSVQLKEEILNINKNLVGITNAVKLISKRL